MSKIIDRAIFVCYGTFFAIEAIAATGAAIAVAPYSVATAIAPIVSLVAVPIFAVSALTHWIQHRSLYPRTLTNLTREKFGRIPGQDYTRWDGKAVNQESINSPETQRLHELMGLYIHGSEDGSFIGRSGVQSSFKTQEDAEWLNREFACREKKDWLDSDLRMLRAFSKALIPVIGVIWVLLTETGIGGASPGCIGCMRGESSFEKTHWDWRDAIIFHRRSLEQRLQSA